MKLNNTQRNEFENIVSVSAFINAESSEHKIAEFLSKIHTCPEEPDAEFESCSFIIDMFDTEALAILEPVYGSKDAQISKYVETPNKGILIGDQWLIHMKKNEEGKAVLHFEIIDCYSYKDEKRIKAETFDPYHHLAIVRAILTLYFRH